ncbi:MAG: hypothetical protein NC338_03465 [Firmicutes bacterium]|nr:hypothetical protein [Bacillota bacterium]MCM1401294.1 hypothetical protein [Bacteroides sp.]MCM1476751.1 hypothetical protein [Bacteroides sp.]
MSRTAEPHNLLCDYLEALGVPYTCNYSQKRFAEMPFHTLFGVSKLLEEYGVKSEGYLLNDRKEISKLTPPFLARTAGGIVIVTGMDSDTIHYLTQGVEESMPLDKFTGAWCGNVMLSFPGPNAQEPDYGPHSRIEFLMKSKRWVLTIGAVLLFLYAFITNRLYAQFSTIWIAAVDLAGLYLTYLLVQKSLKIHNGAADKVCGVLEAHGCDHVLEMKASKFFGLFGWSEVGFAYFSVSLGALLMFPQTLPMLALCDICCLPFTAWSIWYQRFRAHRWCTLCVCVQCSLWLLFFGYLGGGFVHQAWPPTIEFIVLGLCYVTVMLAVNALMPLLENQSTNRNE